MQKKPKVLVVEDEADIHDLLCLHLKREGFEVEGAYNGEDAIRILEQKAAQNQGYDLLILDWMLPGLSGMEIVRSFRKQSATPILMVTARTEQADIIAGLEAGADDYVTKPFELPVLMARARALLRRARQLEDLKQKPDTTSRIILGNLVIDLSAHEAQCGQERLQLTLSEFKLLHCLALNQGRVLTRDQLIESVQGEGVTVIDRAIDTHVFGLRKKLGECSDWIETVRGVGYRIRSSEG